MSLPILEMIDLQPHFHLRSMRVSGEMPESRCGPAASCMANIFAYQQGISWPLNTPLDAGT